MKRILPLLIIVATLATSQNIFAQKQGYNWYFGQKCALNFSSGSPVFVAGGQTGTDGGLAQEGTSSISDSAGNLLFYSGGQTVWNRNNEVMPHGDSILGGISSTQSCLIVPLPGSDSLFYLFTVDQFQTIVNGCRYSIINMCLDNGLGDVVPCEKNIRLVDTALEKICGMRDSLGNYWILVHKVYTNSFYAYYLTSAGITNTVITNIGTIIGSDTINYLNAARSIGQMKFSPNGKKVALALGNQIPNILDIYDFDPATGVLSNWITTDIRYNTGCGYGIEFSPDNSKLYADDLGGNLLLQYNMSAGSDSAIIASRDTVSFVGGTIHAGMQLGTDGKIYISNGSTALDVINFPNLSGAACNFVSDVISLNGNNCFYTVPSFIANFNYGSTVPLCNALTLNNIIDTPSCNLSNGSITIQLTGGVSPNSITWNTTPIQTGLNATNLSGGTYIATLSDSVVCDIVQTIYDTVQIPSNSSGSLNVNSPTICSGNVATLTASGFQNYTWSPSTGLSATTGGTVTAEPTATTTYIVIGNNIGCSDTAESVVTVNPTPNVQVAPSSTTICTYQGATLLASGATTYQWSPSTGLNITTGDSVIADPTVNTTYTVIGTSNGCSDSAQSTVSLIPAPNIPTITIHGDTLISSAKHYNQWFRNDSLLTDDTSQILIIGKNNTEYYFVEVTNPANGCSTNSDSTTSIAQLSPTSNQLSIYPNPFNATVFIKIKSSVVNACDWNLLITDVLGRTVYTKQSLSYSNEIDLSNLTADMYFITVINKTGQVVVPIVKQ